MNRRSILLWTAAISVLASTVITTVIVVTAKQMFVQLKQPLNAGDHFVGRPGAKEFLVVYSDFQCQSCAYAALDLKRLEETYAGKLVVVHRHFPLPAHGQAVLAARAAEAAGKQGRYFEMHDLLFQKQNEWVEQANARQLMVSYASVLSLNVEQFAADLDSDPRITAKIEADVKGALASGARGTPAWFLNGRLLPSRFDAMKGAIDEALAR